MRKLFAILAISAVLFSTLSVASMADDGTNAGRPDWAKDALASTGGE